MKSQSEFLEVMLVKDISNVKVIYREDDDGLEIENNVFEKILKKGVWVLYGKESIWKGVNCYEKIFKPHELQDQAEVHWSCIVDNA